MEGDREDLCGPKGRHQAERPAWRGGSVASQVTLGGRQVAVPRLRVRRARRGAAAELPMGGGHRPAGRAHALGGRRRGVDAAVCGHVGPGAGRGDGAGDVEQRGVSTVRGAVGQAPAVVSQPAVGRAGPAGGLHRRQGLPGALHGGGVGDRHAGLQARPGTARRGHRDGGRRQRPAQRPGDARPADGPDVAVRHRRRAGAAPGHHRCLRFPRGGATVPSTQAAHVLGHLPERLHASVGKALRDAWDLDSADRAARVLARLAGSLERDHPGAAASIREGLEETLTVQRLGLTGSLERTLRTTNIIENLMGSRGYTRRVKRRSLPVGGERLVEAEPRFRRVRGYRTYATLDRGPGPVGGGTSTCREFDGTSDSKSDRDCSSGPARTSRQTQHPRQLLRGSP